MARMLLDEQRNEIADRPVGETGMSAGNGSLNISRRSPRKLLDQPLLDLCQRRLLGDLTHHHTASPRHTHPSTLDFSHR